MNKELLAVFSGFPEHHFSEEITERLCQELTVRKSIVSITAYKLYDGLGFKKVYTYRYLKKE